MTETTSGPLNNVITIDDERLRSGLLCDRIERDDEGIEWVLLDLDAA